MPVNNAFNIMALRMKAKEIGIDKLEAGQGRLLMGFKDRTAIPPRVFTILARKNKQAYVARDSYIWPYTGNCLPAIEAMMNHFVSAMKELEDARASLGL